MEGNTCVVPRRVDLHRRDLQESRKDDIRQGPSLDDPSGLFHSSLEGRVRRAIDFREGDKVNEKSLKALIRTAVALNKSSASDG